MRGSACEHYRPSNSGSVVDYLTRFARNRFGGNDSNDWGVDVRDLDSSGIARIVGICPRCLYENRTKRSFRDDIICNRCGISDQVTRAAMDHGVSNPLARCGRYRGFRPHQPAKFDYAKNEWKKYKRRSKGELDQRGATLILPEESPESFFQYFQRSSPILAHEGEPLYG
jgi:hypothetical protein